MNNGCDLNCGNIFIYLKEAVEQGFVKEERLDEALVNLFTTRFKLGIMGDKTAFDKIPYNVVDDKPMRDLNVKAAEKCAVLLKNENNLLPLKKNKIKTIGIIGPNADNTYNQLGDYTAPQYPGQTVTPKMAFEAMGRKHGFEVVSALGCRVRSMKRDGFAEAIAAAKSADAVVLCLGGSSVPDMSLAQNKAGTAIATRAQEDSELDKDTGEGFERAILRLGGVQNELLAELRKTGKEGSVEAERVLRHALAVHDVVELRTELAHLIVCERELTPFWKGGNDPAFAEARADARLAIQTKPREGRAWEVLGIADLREGEWASAKENLLRAAELMREENAPREHQESVRRLLAICDHR